MISVDLVIDIHHEILQNEPGLKGLPDRGKLDVDQLSHHLQTLIEFS